MLLLLLLKSGKNWVINIWDLVDVGVVVVVVVVVVVTQKF